MISLLHVLKFYFAGFAAFLIIYLIGSILFFPFKKVFYTGSSNDSFYLFFIRIFFGVVGCITILASYCTNLKTVFSVYLSIYFIALIYTAFKKELNTKPGLQFLEDSERIIYVAVLWVFVLVFFLFKFQFFNSSKYFLLSNDIVYYINASKALIDFGKEVSTPWNCVFLDEKYLKYSYHFSDLWLSGGVLHFLSGFRKQEIYYYVCYPLFTILGCMPFWALSKYITSKNWKPRYSIVFLFLGFLVSVYFGYFPKNPLGFINTITVELKTFNFLFLLAFALYFLLYKQWLLFFLAVGSIPIFDFVFIVPAFVILFSFILVKYLFNKTFLSVDFKYEFLIALFLFSFLIVYYLTTGTLVSSHGKISGGTAFSLLQFLKKSTNSLFRILVTSPHYLFLLFLFILLFKKLNSLLVVSFLTLLLIVLSSVFVSAFASFHHTEYWQFLRPINSVMALSFLFTFPLIDVLRNKKWLSKILMFFMAIYILQSILGLLSQARTINENLNVETKYSFYDKSEIEKLQRFIGNSTCLACYYTPDAFADYFVVRSEYCFSAFLSNYIYFFEFYDSGKIVNKSGTSIPTPYAKLMSRVQDMDECKFQNNFLKKIDLLIVPASDSLLCINRNNEDSLFIFQNGFLALYKIKK